MTTLAIQYWLALAFAPGLNRHFIRTLDAAQLSPLDLLSLPKAEIKALGLNALTIEALQKPNIQQIEQHLNWMKHPMNTIILLGPDRTAVSGVSTHLNLLMDSALRDEFDLVHFRVGSEGREESGIG